MFFLSWIAFIQSSYWVFTLGCYFMYLCGLAFIFSLYSILWFMFCVSSWHLSSDCIQSPSTFSLVVSYVELWEISARSKDFSHKWSLLKTSSKPHINTLASLGGEFNSDWGHDVSKAQYDIDIIKNKVSRRDTECIFSHINSSILFYIPSFSLCFADLALYINIGCFMYTTKHLFYPIQIELWNKVHVGLNI